MSTKSQILEHKIIAIIRGANPDDVLKIAEALYAGGIRLLEITMNSIEPIKVIHDLTKHFGARMIIGAGTVLDKEQLKAAVDAGAKFILSPVMDIELIHAARELQVVSIPGAYTATEIFTAFKNGADIIKVFPADSPAYLKNLRGPMPQVPLLPTGGVTLENIKEFKNAGAVGFGIGSALVDTKKEITEQYLAELTDKAKAFIFAITYSK
ncbi:MAG: bifunctional 4-hydroxy-2-oxoglutarate aldolase/2-dehydro-3-deoxy-phosphogluconate aldolase [Chryseobacterium sp.]|nr:MAG: bifunctional 4-hydroxy-2-oxoglutarate aldolase/2-dehydro-3-deoxy-phosphogluconate aldolase [Chryseobacterium sp.]